MRKRINAKFSKPETVFTHGTDAERPTIQQLRELVANVSKEPVVEPVKPAIFRDDYGRVITERQWNTLQERKRRAKEGGFEIDEYSQ